MKDEWWLSILAIFLSMLDALVLVVWQRRHMSKKIKNGYSDLTHWKHCFKQNAHKKEMKKGNRNIHNSLDDLIQYISKIVLVGPLKLWVGLYITHKTPFISAQQMKEHAGNLTVPSTFTERISVCGSSCTQPVSAPSLLWRGQGGPSVFISLYGSEPEKRCTDGGFFLHLPPTHIQLSLHLTKGGFEGRWSCSWQTVLTVKPIQQRAAAMLCC